MKNRTYPDLNETDRAALQRFADVHGKNWKNVLGDVYWYNARLWRSPFAGEENFGSILHGIRNNYGPTWLWDVCDVKPEKPTKPAKRR